MRALLGFGAVLILVLVCVAIWAAGVAIAARRAHRRTRGLPPAVRSMPLADQETYRLGQQMARLLERGMNDPIQRQTDAWERDAERLVAAWYDTKEIK
jgi:hypothetical protein